MVRVSPALGGLQRKKALSDALDWACLSHELGPHLTVGDLLHFDARRALAAQQQAAERAAALEADGSLELDSEPHQ